MELNEEFVFEGLLWPDHTAELDPELDVKTAFLVDTGPAEAHAKRLQDIAESGCDRNNWMSKYTPQRLAHWATYNVGRGQQMRSLAEAHDQQVFDLADYGIDGAQTRALDYLLGE